MLIYLIFRNKKRFTFYSIANEQNLGENKLKAVVFPVSTFGDYDKLRIDDNENKILVTLKNYKYSFNFEINKENNQGAIRNSGESFYEINKFFEYLKKNNIYFTWGVPLKIIYQILKNQNNKNSGYLKYIVMLGTADSKNEKGDKISGSFSQLDKLEELIKIFFLKCGGNCFDFEIIKKEINDFENFTKLSEKFEEIEDDIKKEYYQKYINYNKNKNSKNFKEIKDEDIAYDITGGQKLVSVAGMFFSLKSRSPILYVSQSNNDNIKVKIINAIFKGEPPE
ncbi:MAG: hypothetical protein ACYCUW_01860 [bacterium]